MVKARWFFILLILSLFIISCGEQNGILMAGEEEYYFNSVDEGSIVAPGSEIPVGFTEVAGQSDLVVIRLTDVEYNEIALVELPPEDLEGEGLPLALPEDLPEGIYFLQFEVWGDGALLSDSETYFYLVDGEFSILSIETYPPNIEPGGILTARVYTVYPEDSTPWLRWSLDGETLLEGFLSDMGSTVSFPVSQEDGIYSLKCELFPLEPEENLVSSLSTYTDLFVSPSGGSLPLEELVNSSFSFSFQLDIDSVVPPSSWDILPVDQGVVYSYPDLPGGSFGTVGDFSLALDFSSDLLALLDDWKLIFLGKRDSGFVLFYNGVQETFYAGFTRAPQALSSLPLSFLQDKRPQGLELVFIKKDGKGRLVWQNNEGVLTETEIPILSLWEKTEGDENLGETWLNAGISGALGYLPDSASGSDSSSGSEYTVLYSREDSAKESISIETPLPGSEFASLEFLLDSKAPDFQWQILFLDDSGDDYLIVDYPISIVTVSGRPDEGKENESVYFSIINNRNGVFIGYEGQVKGPFSVNDSLILKIKPYDSINTGIDAVKEIRLYQD